MGQLADRIAFLTTRYGSDPAAWQHELAALAALEGADSKAALARFHALKRRLVEFRRSQLLRELRARPFVADLPPIETPGWPLKELEADARELARALAHARGIERALREESEALAALRHRAPPRAPPLAAARWDALGALAEATESRRRAAMREARLDRRLDEARRLAGRLELRVVALPPAEAPGEELDAALDAAETALREAERVEEAYRAALAPLKTPEVATYRHESRRRLEREARALAEAGDVAALGGLARRAEALRVEAATLASEAARSRRSGRAPPPRERRPGDAMDGYG